MRASETGEPDRANMTRIFPVYIDASHYRVTTENGHPIAVEQVLTFDATEILWTRGVMSPTVRAVMEKAGIVVKEDARCPD